MKISIITPCLNRANYIEKAIQSVLSQNYSDVEHIIVDGGSTDNTLEVMKKYPHLTIVSESDCGMYDALNKGLQLAQGDIIGFLNTDDQYVPDIFGKVLGQFENQNLDAVAGQAVFFEVDTSGEQVETMRLSSSPPESLFTQIITSGCLMNAWFFRKELCLRVGKFDPKYKISGDADFMIRLNLAGFGYKLLDFPIYYYLSHPDSLTMDLDEDKLQKILKDNGVLAESFMQDLNVPNEVKILLRQNYLNIGNMLANKYLEKFMFSQILELAVSMKDYDPQWEERYMQTHPHVRCYAQKSGLLFRLGRLFSIWAKR
jgi:glycosyltransferase involved in cell wall biosynthesis